MYPDGGGLYLQVTGKGVRSWTFRYMWNGKERYMGLGPLHAVSLADARVKLARAQKLKAEGIATQQDLETAQLAEASARLALDTANENVGQTEASYKLAAENARRSRELFQRGMVSRADLDQPRQLF